MVERQRQSHDAHMTVPVILRRRVDPSTIKIIMRVKNQKYAALRGESRIVAEEQTSFGGEKHLDGALLKQQNLPYKKQILKTWKAVYVEKLGGLPGQGHPARRLIVAAKQK